MSKVPKGKSRYSASVNYYGKLLQGGKTNTFVVKKALAESRQFAELLVKSLSPVRSGNLKAGWKVRTVGAGLLFTNPVPYTGFVELGTKKMAGKHMLDAAVDATREQFLTKVSEATGRHIAQKAILDYTSIKAGQQGIQKLGR
jgi:hypothetical protein